MRTRKKNKETRFRYGADVYGLSSEDEPDDPATRRALRQDDEDDNFDGVNAPANRAEEDAGDDDDEDADGAEIEDEEDDDDVDVDHEAGSDGEEVIGMTSSGRTASQTKVNKRKRRPKLSGHVHAVPLYPTDIRQTRIYIGPLKRWTRYHQLADLYYGDDQQRLSLVYDMLRRWLQYHVLPAKTLSGAGGVMTSPWLAAGFDRHQEIRYTAWVSKHLVGKRSQQRAHPIATKNAEKFIAREGRDLKVLVGSHTGEKEAILDHGRSLHISDKGTPVLSGESQPDILNGWLLEVGGLVLSMKWAPAREQRVQILAMAIIPHSDQAYREREDDSEEDEKRDGCIQFWKFSTTNDSNGTVRPSADPAELFYAMCFDWGRPKRMEWCPIALNATGVHGLLAVLCGDGQVRIIQVTNEGKASQAAFDWLEEPIATLGFTDEYNVVATCMTWVNINRICLGHHDGSISLWSISPCQLISRHPVHISQIIEISSGYPSHPYMIASIPVGGCPSVVDISLPSVETTYIPLPGAISFQPNLISWNDHLQGYFDIHPSPTSANTVVGFTHVRYYIQSRTVFTGPSQPTCISSGISHPFVLVGSADGSLWAFNALKAIMRDRGDEVLKLRIFQHDYRPTEKIPSLDAQRVRGVSRLLQGFLPETNNTGRTDYQRGLTEARLKSKKKKAKKPSNRGRKAQGPTVKDEMGLDDEDLVTPDATVETRFAIQEPLTRITAVAWNPNIEVGWWAAAAMGSGLVRVMDLGVESQPGVQEDPMDVDAED